MDPTSSPRDAQQPNNRNKNELSPQPPIPAAPVELTFWDWLTKPVSAEQWLLPVTGAWILGLDWLLFSPEGITLGLATPVAAVVGFVAGTLGTHFFQTRYGGDKGATAWLKSLAAGLIVGIPFPLAGTFVGGWILFNSGLHSLRDRLLRRK
jgi:hypothetical protein